MKKIAIFIAVFCFYSSAQAGLFEYHLGVQSPTNDTGITTDVLEQVSVPTGSTYTLPSNSSNYHSNSYYNNSYNYNDSCRDWSLGNIRPSCEYSLGYHTNNGSFYQKQNILDRLEDESDRLEDELDYLEDIIRDIKDDIRVAKRYVTPYYKNLRKDLENELDYLEDKKDDLEDREDDIKDEIRKVKKMPSSSRSYYYDYYNTSNHYDYYGYNDYGYYYDRNYYKYDFDTKEYIPHWVNPDLKAVDDGHIYIR